MGVWVSVNAKQLPKKIFPKMFMLFISGNRTSCDFYLLSNHFMEFFTSKDVSLLQAEK